MEERKKEKWEIIFDRLTEDGTLAKLKKAREEFRRKGTL
jgi:hypothetical protein